MTNPQAALSPIPVALVSCRPGLERDAAEELAHRAESLKVKGEVETGQGWVVFRPSARDGAKTLFNRVPFASLIFARQWFCPAYDLSIQGRDRVTPAMEVLEEALPRWSEGQMISEPCIDYPDTDEGKRLADLAKSLRGPLLTACKKRKLVWDRGVGPQSAPALHLFLVSPDRLFACLSRSGNNSPWPLGIPRLKMPPEAPSRSTLKLEEAFLTLLTADEREKLLSGQNSAVDLGAAPGGWTWQLVSRGVKTTCVDNGDLDPTIARHHLVTHLRENALDWTPPRRVDWVVCDVVEKPRLIADLMIRWITRDDAKRAMFNLKLPMKKRYHEVITLIAHIQQSCEKKGTPVGVRCRQLYHDREEVTMYVYPTMRQG